MRPRLPLTVVLLGVASLFGDVGSEMIFPLLPVFLTDVLGASPTFLGLVEGIADTVASFLKLASGWLSDRIGRHKALVAVGYTLASLARPVVALAAAPWHVLAVRVVDRVGKGIRTSPRDALLAEAVPQSESGRAFGFHRAMDHTGAVLGPLLATGLLAAGLPMRTVFGLAMIPGVLSVFAVLMIRPTPPPPAPVVAASPVAAAGPSAPLSGRLRALLGLLVVFNLGHASDAFLVLRAREVGVRPEHIPLLWTAFHLAKVGLVSYGGRLADQLDRTLVLAAGFVVSAVAYVGFAFATDPVVVFVLFIFYALYYGLCEPTERALVKELAPEGARGRAFGWYNALVGGSALPAGLLTGALWDHFGAGVALGIGAATALVATGWLLAWRR